MSRHPATPSPVLHLGLRIGVFIVVLACMVLPVLWSEKSSPAFIMNILGIVIGSMLVLIVSRAIQQSTGGDGGEGAKNR